MQPISVEKFADMVMKNNKGYHKKELVKTLRETFAAQKTVQDVWSAAHRFGQQEVRLPAVTFADAGQTLMQGLSEERMSFIIERRTNRQTEVNKMYISEISTGAPENVAERVPLEQKVYKVFAKLGIPYERVDNDPASSMEECEAIGVALGAPVRKDVFLCNQKKTSFFLLIMPDYKAFDTASFSKKLGVSHMSFASPELMMEHIGCTPGSASVVGVMNDEDDYVQVIIDKDVAEHEWFVCNTGINTTHLKFKTQDLLKKFLPYTHHRPRIVDL